ncbi:hypothetical protein [Anaerosacchariphilus polymeriproducens]|uniref:Uncharacterized protein n=1 Tax=Anaerosacchariphilus polymeriproducens TaxID=1812858 RepID=A0A371ASS2_9FIRM|nr:hypothetical protein [Anaerosacchariphilus polymeriproducens]RDU22611.1 hypothetical protein DWV06_15160 [Anaerosacchariphilus polymeriproducens]
MLAILKEEYMNLLKKMKAIAIVLIFVLFSYLIRNLSFKYRGFGIEDNSLYSSFRFLVTAGGFFFVSVLSHDAIHKESDLSTVSIYKMNYSGRRVFLGIYTGTLLFWYSCLTAVNITISMLEGKYYLSNYYHSIVIITYFISFKFLISSCTSKSMISSFVEIILGIIIFLVGKWTVYSSSSIWNNAKCFFPYFYLDKKGAYLLIPLVISAGMVGTSILLYEGKD